MRATDKRGILAAGEAMHGTSALAGRLSAGSNWRVIQQGCGSYVEQVRRLQAEAEAEKVAERRRLSWWRHWLLHLTPWVIVFSIAILSCAACALPLLDWTV
eukprot:6474570-Prymnesium_polylepis.3